MSDNQKPFSFFMGFLLFSLFLFSREDRREEDAFYDFYFLFEQERSESASDDEQNFEKGEKDNRGSSGKKESMHFDRRPFIWQLQKCLQEAKERVRIPDYLESIVESCGFLQFSLEFNANFEDLFIDALEIALHHQNDYLEAWCSLITEFKIFLKYKRLDAFDILRGGLTDIVQHFDHVGPSDERSPALGEGGVAVDNEELESN